MAREFDSDDKARSSPTEPAETMEDDQGGRDARIGEHLRRIYSDILSEPMPDSFIDLLRKLD